MDARPCGCHRAAVITVCLSVAGSKKVSLKLVRVAKHARELSMPVQISEEYSIGARQGRQVHQETMDLPKIVDYELQEPCILDDEREAIRCIGRIDSGIWHLTRHLALVLVLKDAAGASAAAGAFFDNGHGILRLAGGALRLAFLECCNEHLEPRIVALHLATIRPRPGA